MHDRLTPERAAQFAGLALRNVRREYPHKPGVVLTSDADLLAPRKRHPVFYGCFDWHSGVHGYWLLARLLRLLPDMPAADAVRRQFDEAFTDANVVLERACLAAPAQRGFERP